MGRSLTALRPSVVHLTDAPPAAVLAATVATVGTASALVYEVGGFDSPLLDGGVVTRRALARLDRVIVPSEAVRTALLEAGHDPRTATIGDPIDVRRIPRVVPTRAVDVAWVGPGHRGDDLEAFLLALAEIRDRPWTAALLGPFDGLGDVAAAIDDLGLTARIRVASRPTPRERLAAYRGATTVVQTTPVCAFPTELVWAQAAGCTAVVQYRERSSAHEPVKAHGRGTLVSTPDELPGAIASAIEREPDDVDATFDAYDRARYVDRLEAVYRSALT
ncbi:MAG: glycosyl transferase family 1 [Halobacteriales archaeon]